MLTESQVMGLFGLRGVGKKTVAALQRASGSRGAMGASELVELFKAAGLPSRVPVPSVSAMEEALRVADRNKQHMDRLGIRALVTSQNEFPSQLNCIPDPPVILFVKGDASLLVQPSVAIIGTREPTEFGARMANRLAKMFVKEGFVVVSGLALGCDAAAHYGCLQAGGKTVAVLAHGLDTIHPTTNRSLGEDILASGGCFVSEYPVGERPRPSYFVERDRIQSGLVRGVVVIETGIRGGSMHTVGFAQAQSRLLGALAHPEEYATADKAQGNRKLIAENGATPLQTPAEVAAFAARLRERTPPPPPTDTEPPQDAITPPGTPAAPQEKRPADSSSKPSKGELKWGYRFG